MSGGKQEGDSIRVGYLTVKQTTPLWRASEADELAGPGILGELQCNLRKGRRSCWSYRRRRCESGMADLGVAGRLHDLLVRAAHHGDKGVGEGGIELESCAFLEVGQCSL
jgi:hypothetical protein